MAVEIEKKKVSSLAHHAIQIAEILRLLSFPDPLFLKARIEGPRKVPSISVLACKLYGHISVQLENEASLLPILTASCQRWKEVVLFIFLRNLRAGCTPSPIHLVFAILLPLPPSPAAGKVNVPQPNHFCIFSFSPCLSELSHIKQQIIHDLSVCL